MSQGEGGGCPPKFKTPEELQSAIDVYFSHCAEEKVFPNVAGLTVHLGFAATQSLLDQEARGEKFSAIIKRAKLRMWDGKFQAACAGNMDNTIFIFDSINNHKMINNRTQSKNEQMGEGGGPIKHSVEWELVDPAKQTEEEP